MNAAYPADAEAVAMIARKGGPPPANHEALVQQALLVKTERPNVEQARAMYVAEVRQAIIEEMRGQIERKNSYIDQLENQLREKNLHIRGLEKRVRSQQRILDQLPVRLARRVMGGLRPRR